MHQNQPEWRSAGEGEGSVQGQVVTVATAKPVPGTATEPANPDQGLEHTTLPTDHSGDLSAQLAR